MNAKVSPFFVAACMEVPTEPTGRVSVHTMVEFVDQHGRKRWRRVSLFTDYGISADKAKSMLNHTREVNPHLQLGGRLTIDF